MWKTFITRFKQDPTRQPEPTAALPDLFKINGLFQNLPDSIYKKKFANEPPDSEQDGGGATSSAGATTSTGTVEIAYPNCSQQRLARFNQKSLNALLELLQLGQDELKQRYSATQCQHIYHGLTTFFQDNTAAEQSLRAIKQKSKFTFTLITSIALASIATDLSWNLFTLDAVAATLTSTLTISVLSVAGTFTFFTFLGFIGYFWVVRHLRKEEEKIRQAVLLKQAELEVLDNLIERIRGKTQKIYTELGNSQQQIDNTQHNHLRYVPSTTSLVKKKKGLAAIKSALFKLKYFEPTFIFLTTTATIFISYKTSLITAFAMLGFTAGASFLTGPIGISIALTLALAIASYCAYRNYVSIMSLQRRAKELTQLDHMLAEKRTEYAKVGHALTNAHTEVERLAEPNNQQFISNKPYLAHFIEKHRWQGKKNRETKEDDEEPGKGKEPERQSAYTLHPSSG